MTRLNDRVLRPRTIIPESLYIERAADRQLRRIVDDMERPGYVLVARQMGKTNLLLHMKRRYEREGDIVIYLDLSVRFDSARACFRNIIDLAIEMRPDLFSPLADKISKDRSGSKVDASIEYGRHLRALLQAVPDKRIIIILDEIDSLINASYGNAILSQVRSIYFTRTNFEEYNRLTYTLSGVAEPSDLITDSNVSPFNIGEKIYLDDFTKGEFQEFLNKAGLVLPTVVADRVYYWVAGNPRMTWDLCSSIEEHIQNRAVATQVLVDLLVEHLYLEEFNRPPIDHMRVLVNADAQLRNAVVALRHGRGGALDDKIRSRLYLAGITGSAGRDLNLKNRVIDSALSDSWLAQAASSGIDPVVTAAEHYAGKRFALVVETMEKAGLDASASSVTSAHRIQLGISYFHIEKYDRAIQTLTDALMNARGDLNSLAQYYVGLSHFQRESYAEAIPYLESVVAARYVPYDFTAKMVLATAYFQNEGESKIEKIRDIQRDISRHLKDSQNHLQIEETQILLSSLKYLADTSISLGDKISATGYLTSALEVAPVDGQPELALRLYKLSSTNDEKIQFLKQVISILTDNSGGIEPHQQINRKIFAEAASGAVKLGLNSEIDSLVSIVTDSSETFADVLVGWARVLADEEDSSDAMPLLRRVENEIVGGAAKTGTQLDYHRLMAQHSASKTKSKSTDAYIKLLFERADYNIISEKDIVFILRVVSEWNASKLYDKALELIRRAERILMNGENFLWLPLLVYLRMSTYNLKGAPIEARAAAQELIRVSSDDRVKAAADSDYNTVFDGLVAQARNIVAQAVMPQSDPFRKIGRNDRVMVQNKETGEIVSTKFKNVISLVRDGSFELIMVNDEKFSPSSG